jgi:hypothetical protein
MLTVNVCPVLNFLIFIYFSSQKRAHTHTHKHAHIRMHFTVTISTYAKFGLRKTFRNGTIAYPTEHLYSGRKITASLGNVTVRGEKRLKGQGGRTMANSLSEHV